MVKGFDLEHLSGLLVTVGFERQGLFGRILFVRASGQDQLFERIELIRGRRRDQVEIGLDVAVVRNAELQWRGLLLGADTSDLHTNGLGYAELRTRAEWRDWEEKVRRLAPVRLADHSRSAGPGLLEKTRDAREAAERTWRAERDGLGQPGELAAEEMEGRLSADQRGALDRIMRLPILSGPGILYAEHRAAIAALLLQEESETVELGEQADLPSHPSTDPRVRAMMRVMTKIAQMDVAPDSTVWRVKLLVNTMLNSRPH